jgi:hypothetical protein
MKKSEIVRNMIAVAKSQGVDAQEIINAVISDLGFQRQLARAYVTNNWNKVEAKPAVIAPAVTEEAHAVTDEVAEEAAHAEAHAADKAPSMSKSAIQKREARARAKAAREVAEAAAAGCEVDPVADYMDDVNFIEQHINY